MVLFLEIELLFYQTEQVYVMKAKFCYLLLINA